MVNYGKIIHYFNAVSLALTLSSSAFAMSGDAENGEKIFKKCKSCHSIINSDTGDVIYKGGKTGPNLWGLDGRQAGTEANFGKYGKSIIAAGEAGLNWNEAEFADYVQDPKAYLRAYLDDPKAKSKMAFKLKKDGVDVYAYILSVSPKE